MDNDLILKNLNPSQKEAVITTEGYIRVIAGAGSGKTRALASRFAYIVENMGIESSNILCVTFTNKSANEMKRRIKTLLNENADLTYISTYHGLCLRILKEDITKLNYPSSFVIIDSEDQKAILKAIYREQNISTQDYSYKDVLRFISKMKSRLDYIDSIFNAQKVENDERIINLIFQQYIDKQQKNFGLDFDDLINFTLYLFTKHEDVLLKMAKKILLHSG